MTNEEAIKVLKAMRKDADIHANMIPGVNGHIMKRDALDKAILALESLALESLEEFCDAIDEVFEKYLDPHLAAKLRNEIAFLLAGVDDEGVRI